MGFDVGSGDFRHQGHVGGGKVPDINLPKTDKSGSLLPVGGQGFGNKDIIERGSGHRGREVASSNRPTLLPGENTGSSVLERAAGALTGRELRQQLSPELRRFIEDLMGESPKISLEYREFFDLLSKMFASASSVLDAIFGDKEHMSPEKFIGDALRQLKEMGELITKNMDKLSLTPEQKEQLQKITQELMQLPNTAKNPEEFQKQLQALTKELITLGGTATPKAPDGQASLPKSLQANLEQLVQSGTSSVPVEGNGKLIAQLQQLGLISQLPEGAESVPLGELAKALSAMKGETPQLASLFSGNSGGLSATLSSMVQLLSAASQASGNPFASILESAKTGDANQLVALLGPEMDKAATNLTKFTTGLADQAGLSGKGDEASMKTLFDKLILGGALLGRLIVDKGVDKPTEEAVQAAIVKMNAAKDLGILDQMPFSLFAFYAPFRDEGEKSEAVKEAYNALTKLIRNMMRLVFVLVAIVSAGKKLGEDGMNQLLKANENYIAPLFDELIFCLKKVDELFGVNVKIPMELIHNAKVGLMKEDYPLFWTSMITMLTAKSDLNNFLSEFEDAEPLFESIKSIVTIAEKEAPFALPG